MGRKSKQTAPTRKARDSHRNCKMHKLKNIQYEEQKGNIKTKSKTKKSTAKFKSELHFSVQWP